MSTWRAVVALACLGAAAAHADALANLRSFVADVHSARARFTQQVTGADGVRRKPAAGEFEFQRPQRFRFAYAQPYEQLVVGDGTKVWMHDVDLDQVSVQRYDRALGTTPVALLAGAALERDFVFTPLPDRDGLEWVEVAPKQPDASFRRYAVAFRAGTLAAMELEDAFGQRTRLDFTQVQTNVALAPERFRFTPPVGADVITR